MKKNSPEPIGKREIGGIAKNLAKPKVQNFAEITPSLPFTEYVFYGLYRETFEKSELGRMKRLLPLHEMAVNFGLVRESMQPRRGRKSYFTPEGKVALMFLKMYTQLSMPQLMEQLNANVHCQIFCDVAINPANPLTNYKLLDDIATELATKLKIQQQQDLLAETWKPYMKGLDTMFTDAMCYESEMRYPTDPKLLREGIGISCKAMCDMSGKLYEHRPGTNYLDVEKASMVYRKQRKHSKAETKRTVRRQLQLPGKILNEIRRMEREHSDANLLGNRERPVIDIITRMYRRQRNHFESGDPKESIPDRIVSISNPYGGPIVRGKEAKSVEFGAKCNNIQVDGISFLESLSFNPFNEGTRLKHCITLHRRLSGVDVKKIGGDRGYSGNENRDFCRDNGIRTSFVPRGQKAGELREKDIVRRELARVRATSMEGSFGTQKEHYSMRRIKARRKATEILYIFFGIHAANVVHLAERPAERQQAEAA